MLDDAIEPDDADPDADPATTNPAPTTTDPTTAADPTDEEDEIDLEYWFPSYTEALRELMAEVFEEENPVMRAGQWERHRRTALLERPGLHGRLRRAVLR